VSRRNGPPEAIGKLIAQVLEDLGAGDSARVLRIAERWERAVGPEIASHCRPDRFRGSVLEAVVDVSVWCQQLQMQSPAILEALRSEFGEDAPDELWFRVGR
jgi:predicted nucleic acid-binding Zn ribbon protein